MDLQLFGRVLWRFKVLVVLGLVLAAGLAFLSYVRVELQDGKPVFTYRESESWESLASVFVTSRGFPWGSIDGGGVEPGTGTGSPDITSPAVDPSRLTTLAAIYMQLAAGDGVRRLMLENGPVDGIVQTFPVFAANSDAQLPLITLSAVSATPGQAQALNTRYLDAFLTYMRQQQVSGGIDPDTRVRLQVVREPQRAQLLEGRGLTMPILVFLAVVSAVTALAFVLENLRPLPRPLPANTILPAEPRPVPNEPLPAPAEATLAQREAARRTA